MSHTQLSHVTHMKESCHTCARVTLHTWLCHLKHLNESCATYKRVMAHTVQILDIDFEHRTVIHYNTLQHTATHTTANCHTLNHTASHLKIFGIDFEHEMETHCSALQHVVTHCSAPWDFWRQSWAPNCNESDTAHDASVSGSTCVYFFCHEHNASSKYVYTYTRTCTHTYTLSLSLFLSLFLVLSLSRTYYVIEYVYTHELEIYTAFTRTEGLD